MIDAIGIRWRRTVDCAAKHAVVADPHIRPASLRRVHSPEFIKLL